MKRQIFARATSLYLFFAVLLTALPFGGRAEAAQAPVRGLHAMVVSQHELASKIGVDVMKRGGNAIDAAVAVGLVLAVVYPEAGNLGGGGFMLIRRKDGTSTSVDYREKAPAAASRNIFVDSNGKLIVGEGSSTIGYRASGVPGTLAGFEYAFNKYGSGKIKWGDIVEPARAIAQNGYVLSYRLSQLFKQHQRSLSKYPESKRVFLNGGKFFNEGDLFRQPDLARTLQRIKLNGAKEFYTGETARLIAADMQANKGLITLADLKNYQPKERAPLKGTYRGCEVITMPPPSSGGAVMLESLNILENYDLRAMEYNSAAKYHVLTEAMRRSFADRAEFLGDADFADVPIMRLIDKRYAEQRRESIKPNKASLSSEVGHGAIAGSESMDTTNFAVVDPDGNMVVNTYTINDLYGSAVTAKGTGILLNDEMDDFAARPGEPNMFGLIQGERNAVQGGKRPLSSMTPTIVMRKDGTPWFGVGARGGPRIISAVLQIVIDVVDHGMDIQQAIDAPRIHHQWLPDELIAEPYGMSPDTRRILREFGHVFAKDPSYVATATGIMIDNNGARLGAIDPRSDGLAVGY